MGLQCGGLLVWEKLWPWELVRLWAQTGLLTEYEWVVGATALLFEEEQVEWEKEKWRMWEPP